MLLNLQSPKDGCYSTSDDLYCSLASGVYISGSSRHDTDPTEYLHANPHRMKVFVNLPEVGSILGVLTPAPLHAVYNVLVTCQVFYVRTEWTGSTFLHTFNNV